MVIIECLFVRIRDFYSKWGEKDISHWYAFLLLSALIWSNIFDLMVLLSDNAIISIDPFNKILNLTLLFLILLTLYLYIVFLRKIKNTPLGFSSTVVLLSNIYVILSLSLLVFSTLNHWRINGLSLFENKNR